MGFWRIVLLSFCRRWGSAGERFRLGVYSQHYFDPTGLYSRPDPRLWVQTRLGLALQTRLPRDPLGESGSLYTAAGYPSTSSGESPRPGRRSHKHPGAGGSLQYCSKLMAPAKWRMTAAEVSCWLEALRTRSRLRALFIVITLSFCHHEIHIAGGDKVDVTRDLGADVVHWRRW